MEPHSVELCESVFFTARTVTLPLVSSLPGYSDRIYDEMNPMSESSSSSSALSNSRYSTRICDLMKLKSESGMSKEDAEIEASKSHWTETVYHTAPMSACSESSEELLEAEKLYKENVEVMKSLQREDPTSRFFQIGGKVSGRKIGEGGQAAIYDGGMIRLGKGKLDAMVLKVFKGGYSLRDLQKQWPPALFPKYTLDTEPKYFGFSDRFFEVRFNPVWCGRLLEDGRFAFEMYMWWGDIRKLLDVRLMNNGNHHPPLMMSNGHYHECCILQMMYQIAKGMEGLHKEGTLHRDLKASNVLIEGEEFPEIELDPLELKHAFFCTVADYECSIGVVGTGFWRAPEILDAVKNQIVSTTPNLFTTKTDVYSYAMTCYEILTGLVPFELADDYGTRNEDVIAGKRPTLPKHLKPWIGELFKKCWHANPLERPSFEEIVKTLSGVRDICFGLVGVGYYEFHEEYIHY